MNCADKQTSYRVRFVCVALLLIGYHSASSNCRGKVERVLMPATLSYDWRQTDSSVAVLNRGRVVWQVNFDKKEGKPYLHPVGLTDGTVLTCLRPADHRWHRALWFSWKYINGLNYWEEDPKTGLSQGRTEVVDVKVRPHRDRSGDFEMTLSYHPPGKPSVLTEKRLIAIGAPDENGQYHIDWHSTFTAGEKDVVLDRTPIPGEKDSKGWGGYAGLSIRMAKATRSWQFTDSEGRKDKKAHGKKARWVDFSGETSTGQSAGITIFDHPENLRHPSPWYVEKGMPYFSPAGLFNKPYTLGAGKSLTLRYRILIHVGRAGKDLLEKEWKTFLKTTDIHVRFESAKKLSALGRAMVLHKGDYVPKIPDDVRELHKYGELNKEDLEWFLENGMYLGKGITSATWWPNTVFAYDKTLLEKRGCTNVLFGDLRVDFLEPEQLEKLSIREFAEGGHKPGEKIKVVVVTGGHAFERKPFFTLFEGYDDIEYIEAQLKDHSEIFEDISGWDYDVVVFFNMTQKISPKRQDNFVKLVKSGTGVLALHHCMGSYQQWPEYIKIIGGRYNLKASEEGGVKHEASTYKHDADFTVHIEDTSHPITRGMTDFAVHDETYKKCSFEKDNHILLTTNHPDSDTQLGWVRRYGKGKVCFIMVGHGPSVYAHPSYRQLVTRAIRWCAN